LFVAIKGLTIFSSLDCGGRLRSLSEGGSVASANAAKVSIIKFTHNICTEVRGGSAKITLPANTIKSATTFTVN